MTNDCKQKLTVFLGGQEPSEPNDTSLDAEAKRAAAAERNPFSSSEQRDLRPGSLRVSNNLPTDQGQAALRQTARVLRVRQGDAIVQAGDRDELHPAVDQHGLGVWSHARPPGGAAGFPAQVLVQRARVPAVFPSHRQGRFRVPDDRAQERRRHHRGLRISRQERTAGFGD